MAVTSSTPRLVYLEPLWNLHAFQRQMQAFPPPGYEFVTSGNAARSVTKVAAGWKAARSFMKAVDTLLPTNLVKVWSERRKSPPRGAVLTYAIDHVVLRPEPWVVEVEYAGALVGVRPKHLARYRGLVSRLLASPFCRRIICWSEAGRRSLADLEWDGFHEKTEVIPFAVPPKHIARSRDPKRVRLLFVGSGTSSDAFEGRGSEIFEVFRILRQRYPQLELVVRSDVPDYVRRRYAGLPGLRLMDKRVSDEVLDQEYQSADIFLFPSYYTLPFTILEAMSYGLPIVTIDSWANGEYVEHGVTGIVASRPSVLPPFYPGTRQPNFLHSTFPSAVQHPDADCVATLITAVAKLVDQPDLRLRLGSTARHEVERGRFSLSRMNKSLSRVFDEALSSGGAPPLANR